ncbi:MAG: cyclopropane fatty acyl phospholipid synthase [Myxococcales bacterium]|nr:cyclopropane fatty acyl phospholipid synthase [Myxococcales bacterium]
MMMDGAKAMSAVREMFEAASPAKRGQRAEAVVRELFEYAGIDIGGGSRGHMIVHDERFYERFLRDKSIGLGESFMDGWWTTDALDVLIEKILRADLKSKVTGSWKLKLLTAEAMLFNRQDVDRAQRSIQAHYDIGNDLYERMLDPRMVYTCAYWTGATTLEEAQDAKLDLVCRKVGLEPGMKVLDLGCGWGGFALYAAEKYGCTVEGLTISRAQAELGQARAKASGLPVTIRLADYREAKGKYDRVVSIGMMEHVGPKNYRTVMQLIHDCMKDDSVALVHTITNNRSVAHGTPFVEKYIFPNAVAPSPAQLCKAMEGLMVLEDLHNIGPHYDPTLMAWWERFDAAYPELQHKYDRRFYRMWQFYLLGAAGASRSRDGQLLQLVMTKTGRKYPDHCRAS